MKKRSRTDIVALILEAANDIMDDRITKTKIMYKTYLSSTQLKEYLSTLVESDLLEYREYNRAYKTTEKGIKFIHAYNQLGNYIAKTKKETKS